MKYLLFSLLLCFSAGLSAEISLLDVNRDGNNQCLAEATVRATGTAGPFTVRVTGGTEPLLFENVDGDLTIDGLCARFYTIEVFPTRFPTCGKTFTANMQNVIIAGAKSKDEPSALATLADNQFLVEATPNPADGPVTVAVYQNSKEEELPAGKLEITVLTETGAALQRLSVARAGRKTTFTLDAARLRPGAYLIRVVASAGDAEGTGRLIVK